MWTKDTLASDVVAAHKAHLGRVNPKLMEKGCAGLAWCDALIAVNPDITIGQMLVHGEQALKSGDAHSAWPLDLLAAQNARMAPDVRQAILRLLRPDHAKTALHHIRGRE